MKQKTQEFSKIFSSKNFDTKNLREVSWGGIPQEYRPISWLILLNIINDPRNFIDNGENLFNLTLKNSSKFIQDLYSCLKDNQNPDQLLNKKNEPLVRQIILDIQRLNFIDISDKSKMIEMLLILLLVSKRTPAVSYIQGMADLLEPIMCVYDCIGLKYLVYKEFIDSISENLLETQNGVYTSMDQVSLIFSRLETETWAHMRDQHIETHMYAYRWFSCFFYREFDMNYYLRILDSYFSSEYKKKFPIYLAVAMLSVLSKRIKKLTFEEILILLQECKNEWTEADIEKIISLILMYNEIFRDSYIFRNK